MNEGWAPVIRSANQHLAPAAPFAALQQQEVTTLENVEERGGVRHSSGSPLQLQSDRIRPSCAHRARTQRRCRGASLSFIQQIAMSLKNGNTVALERRMDLASLFCMIGRHGPAVALAVVAIVSVLAGFIIYRSVRGKRRKAAEAAAADGDSKSPGVEGDASVIRSGLEQSPEEQLGSAESTGKNFQITRPQRRSCRSLQVWESTSHYKNMITWLRTPALV